MSYTRALLLSQGVLASISSSFYDLFTSTSYAPADLFFHGNVEMPMWKFHACVVSPDDDSKNHMDQGIYISIDIHLEFTLVLLHIGVTSRPRCQLFTFV